MLKDDSKQLGLARWAAEYATKKAKAEGARVSVNRQRYVSLEYRERKIEKLESLFQVGVSFV